MSKRIAFLPVALITVFFLSCLGQNPSLASMFTRGDVDGSGDLQISDGIVIFSFLFLGSQGVHCKDAADVNDSGDIDITDGIYLLNYLFLGGTEPASPFLACGDDETDDALDCESHGPCESDQDIVNLEFFLDTAGGFTGQGSSDYALRAGTLTVFMPFHDPKDCSGQLEKEQMDRILAEAANVRWSAIRPEYLPPQNPHCCCDQFVYDFSATIQTLDGESIPVITKWCDESRMAEMVPADLLAFLDVVREVGAEVVDANCPPE